MTPFYSDDHLTLYGGDCREILRELPAESVHCVVTSPPYWGLRDYGIGEKGLGLEATPEAFVANMVDVFREVKRVLRKDGTLWLNLGDSYASPIGGNNVGLRTAQFGAGNEIGKKVDELEATRKASSVRKNIPGLKPKDLVGIPWRVAFALQADGWYLRSDIIWAKPNPMPESVTDRPTKAHEYLFLLTPGQWLSRVVQPADLDRQRMHLFDHLRSKGAPVGDAARMVGVLAEAIFDRSELQQDLGLPPLYAEVWQERDSSSARDLVARLPVVHRAAVWAARFLTANASAEEFLREVNALWVALPERDDLLERWCASERSLSPSVDGDGEATVTIQDAGKVGEVKFGRTHGLTISRPSSSVYYYDAEAVRESVAESQVGRVRSDVIGGKSWNERQQHSEGGRYVSGRAAGGTLALPGEPGDGAWSDGSSRAQLREVPEVARRDEPTARELGSGRNLRSVWNIATEPYPGAHFATFPRKLVEPCVKAGTSERGVCPECGAPWVRETVVTTNRAEAMKWDTPKRDEAFAQSRYTGGLRNTNGQTLKRDVETTGWRPSCTHEAEPVPAVVLDPFAGSGTTLLVAQALGRRGVGIDLSPDYLKQALERNRQTPLGLVG